MSPSWPSYLTLLQTGELACRVREAVDALADCSCCPRLCHADRRHDDSPRSYCRSGRLAVVSSAFPHHGEEDCLRGRGGSGTIFFSNCDLRCVFCQNFDISWEAQGQPVAAEQLADQMLLLQESGCHNINMLGSILTHLYICIVPRVRNKKPSEVEGWCKQLITNFGLFRFEVQNTRKTALFPRHVSAVSRKKSEWGVLLPTFGQAI